MDNLLEIINFLVRWVHIYFAVFWIGTSFFFVWLDFSLKKRADALPSVLGESWLVHGGGFYFVEKYKTAPASMPARLHWFFIDSYMTFVSGFLLMCVLYYARADILLIDKAKIDIAPTIGVLISMGSLAIGFAVYHYVCKSPIGKNTPLLAVIVFAMVMGIYVFYSHVFTDRAAMLHVGAFIATMMTANVFFVIIPNQRKVVDILIRGEEPSSHYGLEAKQRSLHNNYLGLPVLLMMVSNHYPVLFANDNKYLVLASLLIFGGLLRHSINQHDQEKPVKAWLIAALVAGIAMVVAIIYQPNATNWQSITVTSSEVKDIMNKHCIQCHSNNPTYQGITQAPQNLVFESLDQVRTAAPLIFSQVVQSDNMPLGNETGMTIEERQKVGAWIKQGAKE